MEEENNKSLKHSENSDLNLILDDLDDQEFDIPAVTTTPTLESILNEPDDELMFVEDQVSQSALLQGDAADTLSMSSQDGVLDTKARKKTKKNVRYEKHGSILRHVILKAISAQMMSAMDRVDAGMPTAMSVSSFIAVGTSHGLVLVFDPKQVLKWCLGSTAVGAEYGAVSALSFNRDCTRLLSGFAKGQITMWDLTNGKLLRTITDAHPPGTAILHIKFTDELTLAVCSDSGGSVFELEFRRLIGVRTCESRCLFSGSRGEACVIEPLHMNDTITDHPLREVSLLAMASLTKILIVTLRPQLKVLFTHPLKGDSATLPLLSWQFVIIQVTEHDRVIDPVLACARDQSILFFQVVCRESEEIHFTLLQRTELSYKLLSVMWLNSRTLVVVDTSERAHVLDVRSEEELEVVDMADIQLTYSTSFYKSLATGGNVSRALAFAGERACYQSLVSYNNQLVVLGTRSLHVMTVRNWSERVDVLVKHGRYKDALTLAQSFYEGKAKAVVGLVGGPQKRKAAVSTMMLELLHQYVDLSMNKLCPQHGKIQELEKYFQSVVPVCVDYCLTLNRMDILFGSLYDIFSADVIAKGTFLECLEPYILSDRLQSVMPTVMQDFVTHYTQKGWLDMVEACIVHLDITSLDIHQIIPLCWAHGLYDAILYIYNKGMNDYTTPLEELMVMLECALKSGIQLDDDKIKLGNKLLVYISCCMAGRAYPLGDIPDDIVTKVKFDVFQCVTCLHTVDHDDDEKAYPHLKSLLQFDTREFFNVLALAFEEPEFSTEEGLEQRQRIVDILLQIMVESIGFTPTQVGVLFTFLARQMARHDNKILVSRLLFEQVLEFLTVSSVTEHGMLEDARHEERQQALLELLHAGGIQHFDEERLLVLAEKAKFYRVCELLYETRKEYHKILNCYLKDTSRQLYAFSYIEQILTDQNYSIEEKKLVQDEAIKQIKDLVQIDSRQTAQLMLIGFSNSLGDIVKIFQQNEEVLFDFLQGVFELRDTNNTVYLEHQIPVEDSIHVLYIELMCKFTADKVYSYITKEDDYDMVKTLQICQKYKMNRCCSYLLEKTGDIEGAFKMSLNILKGDVDIVTNTLISGEQHENTADISWKQMLTSLQFVIQLCQRTSNSMDESDRELMWFPLLDIMMAPQRTLRDKVDKQHLESFKDLTSQVLNSMTGYIALPAILQKIMQDPAYKTGKFGDIKELLLGLLDTYNYEQTLLHTCNQLVNHDLYVHLASLIKAAKRGIASHSTKCRICTQTFTAQQQQGNSESDPIVCFRCGHGYHTACLRAIGSCRVLDNDVQWACYLCNSARRGRLPSSGDRVHRQLSNQSLLNPSGAGQIKNARNVKLSVSDVVLDPEQEKALEALKRIQKTPSRMAILAELHRAESSGNRRSHMPGTGAASNLLENEQFKLKLGYRVRMHDE